MSGQVTVHLLGPSERGTGARLVHDLLARAVPPVAARVRYACVRCGSSRHGHLVVQPLDPGAPPVWACVSRSADATAVAISASGPVGVDLETDGAAGMDEPTLQRWCAIEAALKVTGWGLAIDPDRVQLRSGSWADGAVVSVPGPVAAERGGEVLVRVRALTVAGQVGSVAELADRG